MERVRPPLARLARPCGRPRCSAGDRGSTLAVAQVPHVPGSAGSALDLPERRPPVDGAGVARAAGRRRPHRSPSAGCSSTSGPRWSRAAPRRPASRSATTRPTRWRRRRSCWRCRRCRASRGRSAASTGCCSRRSTSPTCAPSDPTSLGDVGHYLPATFLAFNVDGDAVSTDLNLLTADLAEGARMPSITTWSRLEPQTSGRRRRRRRRGYAARVHDPLWLLARQWQVGEFQAEDGGTPIVARWRARVAPMTRFVVGPIPTNTQLDAPRFDAGSVPLETLVERQPCVAPTRRTAPRGRGRPALPATARRCSAAQRPRTGVRRGLRRARPDRRAARRPRPRDAGVRRLVAGRALDGRRLRAALGDPADPAPRRRPRTIDAGDRAEVVGPTARWVAWRDALFSEPGRDQATGLAAGPDGVRLLALAPGSATTPSTSAR